MGMVESAIDELNELCKQPERIIRYVEQKHDSPSVTWEQPRIRRRRRMDDENAEDEPAETPEDHWKRNTFYVSVDTILNSLKNRFEKNQPLLQAFSLFAPSRFPQLVKNFKTAHDLQACLNTFCETNSTVQLSASKKNDDGEDDEGDDDYDGDDGEDNDDDDEEEEDDDDEISSTAFVFCTQESEDSHSLIHGSGET
ncbi:Hypothetical predicted protein [Paramuricea clavata]|uniref:Uncharacterized protein n=1 Tax=Paramuricea clavata TaxID=317549 RepID=A0A6S7HB65_PARCT|nr:Hypothetical predicted protein [Paramuricea clavata]